MSWGGFGSYTGNSATSAYANRGSATSPSYGRGGFGSGRGYGNYGNYGGYGGGTGVSYGASYKAPASYAAFKSGGVGDGHGAASGTARVAVIGTTHTAFTNWWAIHAAGFRVGVVVGSDDRTAAQRKFASEEERRSAAETARVFAKRCVGFYHLPTVSGAGASSSGVAPTSTVSSSGVGAAVRPVGTSGSSTNVPPVESETEKRGEEVEVRVRVAAGASAAAPSPTSTTETVNSAETAKDVSADRVITATSWSDFFAAHLDASAGGASGSSTPPPFPAGGYGSRPTTTGAAVATTAAPTPIIDDVEVVFLVSYANKNTEGTDSSADTPENKATDAEAGVRDALLWLISKGKHVVVDCALSAATIAACASAAAAVVRGKSELQRMFLYRGGGVRCGWSPSAMTQLRSALAVRRGTGQASAGTLTEKEAAAATAGAITTTKSTPQQQQQPVVTPAKPKAAEADTGFSVFDFMDSDVNPFGGTTAEAEAESSTAKKGSGSAGAGGTAATPADGQQKDSAAAAGGAAADVAGTAATLPSPPLAPALATSIAVDAEAGVAGALQLLRITVRGRSNGVDNASAVVGSTVFSALGVMATLGWDAVAWALHLLDWTCPDMVEGRVVRRSSSATAQLPLCVEATLYYGIDGSVVHAPDPSTGASGEEQTRQQARPQYLRVCFHISASEDESGAASLQQSVRAMGTKAVVSIAHPLLPAKSTSAVKASAPSATSSPPPTSASATSPFKVTTTRSVSSAGLESAGGGAFSVTATDTAATTVSSLPSTPSVAYRYTVATQDAPRGSSVRMRREEVVTVPCAEGDPCAEARLWQHVHSQLRVTTTTSATTTTTSATGGAGGGYQPYGSRYATRSRYGAGSAYARGRGTANQSYGGVGGGYGTSAAAATTHTVVKAELTAQEAAAADVQHAWLVQLVVEQIMASATAMDSVRGC